MSPFPTTLELLTDLKKVRSSFEQWQRIILRSEHISAGDESIVEGNVSARRLRSSKGLIRFEFWLDNEKSAAIQINEPSMANEDPLSGIGVDKNGKHYLIRQGFLRKNNTSPLIKEGDFFERTSIPVVSVNIGSTPGKRQWHIVTPLDGLSDSKVRRNTVDFVDKCWIARTWKAPSPSQKLRIERLFGKDETGGRGTITPNNTAHEFFRVHGDAWRALAKILRLCNIKQTKPAHARGYEADMEISNGSDKILIEIKTSSSAADVYTGVGQLTIYPIILPELKQHSRILLLPNKPKTTLIDALTECDIELHWYNFEITSKTTNIRFSERLLARCGVPDKRMKEFRAIPEADIG